MGDKGGCPYDPFWSTFWAVLWAGAVLCVGSAIVNGCVGLMASPL